MVPQFVQAIATFSNCSDPMTSLTSTGEPDLGVDVADPVDGCSIPLAMTGATLCFVSSVVSTFGSFFIVAELMTTLLLKAGQPSHPAEPPVPLQRPSPLQVPLCNSLESTVTTCGGLFKLIGLWQLLAL